MPAEKIHWFGATHAAGCPPVAVRMMVPSGAAQTFDRDVRPRIVRAEAVAGRDHEAADVTFLVVRVARADAELEGVSELEADLRETGVVLDLAVVLQRFSPDNVDSGLLPPGITLPRKFSPMKRSTLLMSSFFKYTPTDPVERLSGLLDVSRNSWLNC